MNEGIIKLCFENNFDKALELSGDIKTFFENYEIYMGMRLHRLNEPVGSPLWQTISTMTIDKKWPCLVFGIGCEAWPFIEDKPNIRHFLGLLSAKEILFYLKTLKTYIDMDVLGDGIKALFKAGAIVTASCHRNGCIAYCKNIGVYAYTRQDGYVFIYPMEGEPIKMEYTVFLNTLDF